MRAFFIMFFNHTKHPLLSISIISYDQNLGVTQKYQSIYCDSYCFGKLLKLTIPKFGRVNGNIKNQRKPFYFLFRAFSRWGFGRMF